MPVRTGTAYDVGPATAVWSAALGARGRPPSHTRTARVRVKLTARESLLLLAEDDGIVGMLLAELARADDGAGPVVPGRLHLSMLFVAPDRWRTGAGGALLDHLLARYPAVGVWTGVTNDAAQGLYLSRGFAPTGRIREHAMGEIVEFQTA